MADPTPTQIDHYASTFGVSRCMVVFVLGMTIPARAAVRQHLNRLLDTMEARAESWMAARRRADIVYNTLNTAHAAATARLEQARQAVVQIPVDEVVKACAESRSLMDTVIQGASYLSAEGIEDIQSKTDDLAYEANRVAVVSTTLARAREALHAYRERLQRWVDLIDAMPS